MIALYSDWIQSNRNILWNASSLVGTTAIGSGLGFIYWWLAARLYPAEAVGLASAVSALLLAGAGLILNQFGPAYAQEVA